MKRKATGSDMQISACREAEKTLGIWSERVNEAEGREVKGEGKAENGTVETGGKFVEELKMEMKEERERKS